MGIRLKQAQTRGAQTSETASCRMTYSVYHPFYSAHLFLTLTAVNKQHWDHSPLIYNLIYAVRFLNRKNVKKYTSASTRVHTKTVEEKKRVDKSTQHTWPAKDSGDIWQWQRPQELPTGVTDGALYKGVPLGWQKRDLKCTYRKGWLI